MIKSLFSDSGLIPYFNYFHAIKIRLFIENTKIQHVQRMDTNRIPKQTLQINQKDEGT